MCLGIQNCRRKASIHSREWGDLMAVSGVDHMHWPKRGSDTHFLPSKLSGELSLHGAECLYFLCKEVSGLVLTMSTFIVTLGTL